MKYIHRELSNLIGQFEHTMGTNITLYTHTLGFPK